METERPQDDLDRYRANLRDEREAIYLYKRLSASEKDEHIAEVLRRLATIERRHAAFWEQALQDANEPIPAFHPSFRTRTLAALARWLGTGTVLPILTNLEHGAYRPYDEQPEAAARGMPLDERSHARVFRYLSFGGRGIAGGLVATLEGRHRSIAGNALRAAVLGANDGLVSNLSLIMGVAGAQIGGQAVIIAGLAGLLAGALSMAIGEWVSVKSAREMYEHQIRVEADEIAEVPEEEKEELALIYQAKGMAESDAQKLAERLLEDPQKALDTLAREELGVDPGELGGSPAQAAIASFILFALGAIVPVIPFMFASGLPAVAASATLSAAALFLLGGAITLLTGRGILFSGVRQVLLGLAAAAITYGLGTIVGIGLSG